MRQFYRTRRVCVNNADDRVISIIVHVDKDTFDAYHKEYPNKYCFAKINSNNTVTPVSTIYHTKRELSLSDTWITDQLYLKDDYVDPDGNTFSFID